MALKACNQVHTGVFMGISQKRTKTTKILKGIPTCLEQNRHKPSPEPGTPTCPRRLQASPLLCHPQKDTLRFTHEIQSPSLQISSTCRGMASANFVPILKICKKQVEWPPRSLLQHQPRQSPQTGDTHALESKASGRAALSSGVGFNDGQITKSTN